VIFALIVFVLGYSVVAYGTAQTWTQGPVILAVLLAVVFWAIRLAIVDDAEVVFSPLGLPLLVTGCYLIIRYALSEVEPVGRSSMLMPVTAGIFFFVVLNDIRHRWQITTIVWILTGLGAVLAVYGLFQAALGGQWVLGQPQFAQYWGRVSGTFFRPADLAVFLQIAFAIAAANFILSHRSKPQKLGFAFACLAIGGGLLLTLSPGHWLGWGVLFCVLVIFAARKRTWHFRWVLAGLSVLALVGVIVVAGALAKHGGSSTDEGPNLHTELDAMVSSQTAPSASPVSVMSQQAVWQAALAIGQPNIWIGGGGGMFPWLFPRSRPSQGIIEHCPNQYLDIFASYGLVGVGLLLWIGTSLVLALLRIINLRDTKYVAQRLSNRYAFVVAGLAIMAAGVVDAWVDLRLHTGGLLFPLTAVSAVALTCGVHRRMEEQQPRIKPGHHVTIRLFGSSRFAIVAGLAGLVLLLGGRLVKTYPSALLLRHGQQAVERLDWSGAEQTFQYAWWFDNRNYQVAAALGDLYAARATWNLRNREVLSQDAFEWYNRALTLNRYATDLRIKIGRLHDALDQRDEALAAYQLALDADPRNASYHVALGQHYLRRDDAAEAQHQFRLARELGATETLPIDEIAE